MTARKTCPIPGCNHTFEAGNRGWPMHIASLHTHPYWLPRETDPKARLAIFAAEYPDWVGKPAAKPPMVKHDTIPSPPPKRTSEMRVRLDHLLARLVELEKEVAKGA